MGDALTRASLLCAAIFSVFSCVGCAPVFDAAREAIQAAALPTPSARILRETAKVERLLNRRFRAEILKGEPHATVGRVVCPPANFMQDIVTCSMRVGDINVPILAQFDVPDKHVSATLGISRYRRSVLERNVAVQIESAYGQVPRVRCHTGAFGWSVPRSQVFCNVEGASLAGSRVAVEFVDSNGWTVVHGKTEPLDERNILETSRQDRRVSGVDVAKILRRRFGVAVRRLHAPYSIDRIACTKSMDLSDGHSATCDVKFDGNYGRERVRFVHDRLAYRVEGADVDLDLIRPFFIQALKRRYKTPASTSVSIDCSADHVVLVQNGGYHWCEIEGPPQYPKRLVIAALDADGHYDVFTSNFSQSAWEHQPK